MMLARALAKTAGGGAPPLRSTSRDLGAPRVDLEDTEALRDLRP
jgi:hypothetical protein